MDNDDGQVGRIRSSRCVVRPGLTESSNRAADRGFGWFHRRMVHLHFKVRYPLSPTRTQAFASQLFCDDTRTDTRTDTVRPAAARFDIALEGV